jgi:hypothetical protein
MMVRSVRGLKDGRGAVTVRGGSSQKSSLHRGSPGRGDHNGEGDNTDEFLTTWEISGDCLSSRECGGVVNWVAAELK